MLAQGILSADSSYETHQLGSSKWDDHALSILPCPGVPLAVLPFEYFHEHRHTMGAPEFLRSEDPPALGEEVGLQADFPQSVPQGINGWVETHPHQPPPILPG